jgi:hypothetical protein
MAVGDWEDDDVDSELKTDFRTTCNDEMNLSFASTCFVG